MYMLSVPTHDELFTTLNEWVGLLERIQEQEQRYKELIGDQLLIMEESNEGEPKEKESEDLEETFGDDSHGLERVLWQLFQDIGGFDRPIY